MALNRGQIIDEGLVQAGRKDLKSNARLWLNLFLDKIYRTQDFEWLVKVSAPKAITDGQTLPGDYRAMKTATLYNNGVRANEIVFVTRDHFENLLRGGATATGAPRYGTVDELNNKVYFYPAPNGNYQWGFLYFHIPTIPDSTDTSADLDEPVWRLHDDVLVKAIQLKALYYNDDQRYQAEVAELMKEIEVAKMNSGDRRGGSSRLKFGKTFRNRFGPPGGRGGF